jgi:vacuolar protein sorting-associated protein 13A/C
MSTLFFHQFESGDVELEGLSLRKDAFSALSLPVEIKGLNISAWCFFDPSRHLFVCTLAGTIGKLTLKIPWSQLRSQPVVITLDNIAVLLGPTPTPSYDASNEAMLEANRKAEQLLASELARLKVQSSRFIILFFR